MIRRYLVGLLVLLSLGSLRAEEPGSGTIVPDPFASATLEKVAKLEKLLREKQIMLDLDEVPWASLPKSCQMSSTYRSTSTSFPSMT